MGTRDSLAQFSIMEGPLIDYYRQRMLADFRASRPEMFVDAVAPGAFLPEECTLRFETFPALREIIERDYQLVAELGNTANTSETVRFYRRRDGH